jgi:hypothetical protein
MFSACWANVGLCSNQRSLAARLVACSTTDRLSSGRVFIPVASASLVAGPFQFQYVTRSGITEVATYHSPVSASMLWSPAHPCSVRLWRPGTPFRTSSRLCKNDNQQCVLPDGQQPLQPVTFTRHDEHYYRCHTHTHTHTHTLQCVRHAGLHTSLGDSYSPKEGACP